MDEKTTTQGTEQIAQTAGSETQEQQITGTVTEKQNALQKFLNGLLGGNKETDDSKKSKGAGDGGADSAAGEKSFTQAELDAAIEAARNKWMNEAAEAERIKKLSPEEKAAEEQKRKDTEISNLRNQLLQKELKESAIAALEKDGFPAELAGVLDYSSKERMEETLKHTTEVFKESLATAIQTRLKGKTPEGIRGAASSTNLIREQIGRNIRGL